MDYHNELLIRVSQLYYEENMNQSDIAGILGTSRPTVSRLLEEAKQIGVVEIIVHDPIRKDPELSRKVRERFGLRDAVIISGDYEYERAIHRCCEAAIQMLNTVIRNNCSIGITWGTVPRILSNILESSSYYNVNIVQMVGCLGTGNPDIDGLELAIRWARKFGGTYSNIYAPIYVKSKEVRDYLINEPQIKAALRKALSTDIIVTGIGSMDDTTVIQSAGYWSDDDRLEFIENGAVGHLLARPFDRKGRPVTSPDWYVVGSELDAMKNAEWSIGVSAAEFKAPATLAAIRGGYINTLIGDRILAEKLLSLADAGD